MRLLKSQRNRIEFFKCIGLLILLTAASLILNWKKCIAVRSPYYLPIYPVAIYIILIFITRDSNFWLALSLPLVVAVVSFVGLVLLAKRHVVQTTRERLAEELLVSCKAFDHGSWATSYLNQLQLFSVNLPANQPISEKIGDQLRETIMGFYMVVYKEVTRIQQLAQDASLQVHQANELSRQVLFLSENLNKIKVALALKQGLSAQVWQNVHRLVDQIKMNVREINFGVTRLFTCEAITIIQKTLSAVEKEVELHLVFATSDTQQQELWVCIKPNELRAIVDNLLQNAQRAMIQQPNPKIAIKLSQTDRYLFVEFSDNGCGVPKKLWEQIFEESYTTKSDGKGGFGLYYSRLMLEKYGGSIEVVKSSKNRGTTFLVKLKRG
jgi:signal transduction histidine kinase